MPSSSTEVNLASQLDEIDLLNSMYPEELTVHESLGGRQSLDIRILGPGGPDQICSVHFQLGPDYPSEAPPTYELSGHFLSREEKREIQGLLGMPYPRYLILKQIRNI